MQALSHSGEFYAAACALLWAMAVIFFRKSGDFVSPLVLNLFKAVVGLVLLVASMLVLRVPFFPAERTALDWIALLASGALGIAAADTLFFASLNRLGAGRSAIVDCLYSPLVILFAFLFLREPIGPALVAATVLIGGAILLGTFHAEPAAGAAARRAIAVGVLYGAISMILMAGAIVAAKPAITRADPWWATTVRMAGALPVLVLQASRRPYRGEALAAFRPGPHWKVLMPGAVLGAYVALILWILGFKYTFAGVAGVINQTSTVMVMVLATLFLREPLTWRKASAIAMGFAGAALVAF
jgi:drug/metabolite transporter (DMT)-like permease